MRWSDYQCPCSSSNFRSLYLFESSDPTLSLRLFQAIPFQDLIFSCLFFSFNQPIHIVFKQHILKTVNCHLIKMLIWALASDRTVDTWSFSQRVSVDVISGGPCEGHHSYLSHMLNSRLKLNLHTSSKYNQAVSELWRKALSRWKNNFLCWKAK